jgi:hypothetical protein
LSLINAPCVVTVIDGVISVGCLVMRITARPWCFTCKHRMGLAQISAGKRGFELRTFVCSTCHMITKVSFPVDPMKTDAVGWLAGELKPPR